ncbi:MAG: glycosyltransferase family 4 protein [Opitutaceae bacterium]|nr:glycosyltransferase family 4 protein [Opitutaceae bacterium]
MRILLLTPELFLADGGIARIMRLYLKALCEICGPDGRIDSLSLNDTNDADPRVARYSNERLCHREGSHRSKWRFVIHTLKLGRQADLLVCGHLGQLAVARLAQLFNPSLRYCLVAHGIEVWRPYTLMERWALRGAHRILCVSDFTRRQIQRFYPAMPAARIVVVPNTLDPFISAEATGIAQTTTNTTENPVILSVGRLSFADAYKGFDTLIEALPAVRHQFPNARLRIVGDGDDLARLKALAQAHGVSDAVEFTGRISDEALRAEYAACTLFALPSRKEGFGLVYLEAMTHGKPCVGARAGGAPEVITEAVGQLADYGYIDDLAATLIELLQHPPDSEVVRRHADSFAFPMFRQRLATALR